MVNTYSVTGRGTTNYKPNEVVHLTMVGKDEEAIRHKIINNCDLSLTWNIKKKVDIHA
jgi:hypothetical protein